MTFQFPIQQVPAGPTSEVEQMELEAKYSPPSNAEAWNPTSTRFHGVVRRRRRELSFSLRNAFAVKRNVSISR
jgi:hypothetical protein